jgi:hypothetical protein
MAAKGDPTKMPIASADEVRHLAGPLEDHAVAEILGLVPTAEDLEVAVAYASGEGDIAGTEGHEISGKPALIYEILLADNVYQRDEP